MESEKMLGMNVNDPARSELAAPIVFVPKKEGSLRFWFDLQKLNSATVWNYYPIPRINECIDSFGDATIFWTLDANKGY